MITLEQAVDELRGHILAVSPQAVLRTRSRGAEEAIIRVYAPAADEQAVQNAVRDRTIELLTQHGLDVQVLVYDVATSLPPAE